VDSKNSQSETRNQSTEQPTFNFKRKEPETMRKSLSIIVSILILSIASAAFADDATTAAAPSGIVNINTADGAQLALLPRVGVKTAQRIVDYRTQHGAFKKTSDLMQVKGFGQQRLI
jgi:competence protein ComEA